MKNCVALGTLLLSLSAVAAQPIKMNVSNAPYISVVVELGRRTTVSPNDLAKALSDCKNLLESKMSLLASTGAVILQETTCKSYEYDGTEEDDNYENDSVGVEGSFSFVK